MRFLLLDLIHINNVVFRIDSSILLGKDEALRKRISRFVHNEGFVHRRATHTAQNTRHSVDIMDDFVSYVNQQITMMDYHPLSIVNIDETNVNYDMPARTTLSPRGSRTVSVTGTGSPNRITVLLGAALNGKKLPPFVIFKGTRNARIHKEVTGNAANRGYPDGVIMTVQKNAWMDEILMEEWVDRVWKPFVAENNFCNSYLLMDQFKGHMVSSVTEKLSNLGTDSEFTTWSAASPINYQI